MTGVELSGMRISKDLFDPEAEQKPKPAVETCDNVIE